MEKRRLNMEYITLNKKGDLNKDMVYYIWIMAR